MFDVDLLSILPDKVQLIRDIFQNYRDFQDRWNDAVPGYAQKLNIHNLSHPEIEFKIVSLDPPSHRLDKQMDNLKRIELRIPVSKLDDDSFKIRIQLIGE